MSQCKHKNSTEHAQLRVDRLVLQSRIIRRARCATYSEVAMPRIASDQSFALNAAAATTDLSTTHARFGGLPDASARQDSTQLAPIPAKHSSVQQMECGVTMSFSSETLSSGLSAGGGSVSKTSMAAPAMMSCSSASSKSPSFTIGPRAVLIKYLE